MWGTQVLIDRPELVCELHKEYIAAGSRVITINAYTVTPERLAMVDSEDQFESLQARAIELAKQARDESDAEDVRIAGCLPPLFTSYKPELAPEYDVILDTYRQIVAQQKDHVDLIVCETMSSVKEATASAIAASESGLPFWVALSLEDNGSGLLRGGESIADAFAAIEASAPQAVLINCSIPEAVTAAWPQMQELACSVGAYANGFTSILDLKAGGGVDVLESRTDLGPAAYADHALLWVNRGARVVGGCCEISPKHIEVLAQRLVAEGYELAGSL